MRKRNLSVTLILALVIAALPTLVAFTASASGAGFSSRSSSNTSSLISTSSGSAFAQSDCATFQETGKAVCGRFLQYWQQNGGLAQNGLPISSVIGEVSDTDGKLYTVQYFERTVFEFHPENRPPNDVLLSLLGTSLYLAKYPAGAPGQAPNHQNGHFFAETGHWVGGNFWLYWQGHGGIAQEGFPLSDEFLETSDLDGQTYTVQYFQRAVFELHPENPEATGILLSQLGTFHRTGKYPPGTAELAAPYGVPAALVTPTPTPVPARPTIKPASTPVPIATKQAPKPTAVPPTRRGATVTQVPGTVSKGSYASVTVSTSPGAQCSIEVLYKSGASTAQGLYPKQAGADGLVSWTWKVGTRTTSGTWPIYITCGSQSITTSVTVR